MIHLLGLLCLLHCVQCVTSQVTMTESGPGTVKPSGTLEVTCKVTGASLTDGTKMNCIEWIRQSERKQVDWLGRTCYEGTINYASSVQGRLTLTKNTNTGEVFFKLTGMKVEESGTYHCARYRSNGGFDIWGKGTFVDVTSAEKRGPSVFPLMPCCAIISSLSEVTIGCLSTSYLPEPVDVTWNSGSIKTGIRNLPGVRGKNGNYMSTSLLTLSSSDFQSNKYTCNVDHKATGTKINVDIGVCADATPIPPTLECMQASCGETGSVDLVCLITGYTPDDIKIKWYLNGKETSISPTNSTPYKDSDGHYGSRSQVSVPKEDWNSGDTYTCRVSHPPSDTRNEKTMRKCSESTASNPKVTINQPSPKDLLITKEPKVTCVVSKLTNTESLTIKWKRNDGKKIQSFQSEPEEQYDGTSTVKNSMKISVADWESGKAFTCVVVHDDFPSPVEKSIHNRNEKTTEPTIYIFPPPPEEISSSEFFTLTCLFKAFMPKNLDIQWKKNDIVIDEDNYTNTEPTLDEINETYFIYSSIIINKSDWNRGARYTCAGLLGKITEKEIKKNRGK